MYIVYEDCQICKQINYFPIYSLKFEIPNIGLLKMNKP